MMHPITANWHDLIEDPTDLPKEKGDYFVRTLITEGEYKGELECFWYDSDNATMRYLPDENIWLYCDDDHDYINHIYVFSYLSPRNDVQLPGMTIWKDTSMVVVAWCEPVKRYDPDVSKVDPSVYKKVEEE